MTNTLRNFPLRRRLVGVGFGATLMFGSVAAVADGPVQADVPTLGEHAGASASELALAPTLLPSSTITQARFNIISLTNRERRARGLAAARSSNALNNACQTHANDMARGRFLSHTGSDGSNGGQRARRSGLGWTTWGENIAAGQRGSAEVVNAWMASSGHRANILNGQFNAIGVGLQQASNGTIYFCQIFVRTP